MNDLAIRAVSGLAMMLIVLLAAVQGGYYFAILVAAAATAMFYEWMRIVRGWGAAWNISGFFYALIPAVALLWIRDRAEHGLAILLWIFIVTWTTDTAAYFVGKAIGRHKLAPSISPGKTVEGLIGGMAGAGLLGGAWTATTELSPVLYILAPLLAFAAQAGDLFESWMKRRAGLKDSGDWLPGHGGVLDRLDGLVPVAILTALVQLAGLT